MALVTFTLNITAGGRKSGDPVEHQEKKGLTLSTIRFLTIRCYSTWHTGPLKMENLKLKQTFICYFIWISLEKGAKTIFYTE